MKYATSFQELDSLGEGLSKDYLRKSHKQNELPFDIEGFITGYLGLTIIYENFAEEDKSKIGYVSDGERPLLVYRNGLPCPVIFPRDAVVIEKFLLKSSEYNRRRFTLAHEAAHKILERHLPFGATASFHTEQDAEADYTRERIDRELSINEVYANRLGAAILMPQFLVQKVLRKYNSGKPLVCYEGNVFAAADRMKIQKMADLLGVSYTAFLVRLREFKLLDYHPIEEYLSEGLQFGGCYDLHTVLQPDLRNTNTRALGESSPIAKRGGTVIRAGCKVPYMRIENCDRLLQSRVYQGQMQEVQV